METTRGLVVWKPQSQNREESPRAGGQEREVGKEGHRGTQPGTWGRSFLDSRVGDEGGWLWRGRRAPGSPTDVKLVIWSWNHFRLKSIPSFLPPSPLSFLPFSSLPPSPSLPSLSLPHSNVLVYICMYVSTPRCTHICAHVCGGRTTLCVLLLMTSTFLFFFFFSNETESWVCNLPGTLSWLAGF